VPKKPAADSPMLVSDREIAEYIEELCHSLARVATSRGFARVADHLTEAAAAAAAGALESNPPLQ